MNEWFKGKKTYIAGIMSVLGAVAAYLSGEAELGSSIQIIITAVLAMFIRDGVNTVSK